MKVKKLNESIPFKTRQEMGWEQAIEDIELELSDKTISERRRAQLERELRKYQDKFSKRRASEVPKEVAPKNTTELAIITEELKDTLEVVKSYLKQYKSGEFSYQDLYNRLSEIEDREGKDRALALIALDNSVLDESYDKDGNPETCEHCGTRLNDMGTCPKCDDGEEDYGDNDLEEALNNKYSPRYWTNRMLDIVEEFGITGWAYKLIADLLNYMSDEEVHQFIIDYDYGESDDELNEGIGDYLKQKKAERAEKKAEKQGVKATQAALAKDKTPEAKTWTYVVNGEKVSYDDYMKLSDEERANAIVVDSDGYYVRKGTADYTKQLQKRATARDVVADNAKYTTATYKGNLRDLTYYTANDDPISYGEYMSADPDTRAKMKAIDKSGKVVSNTSLEQAIKRQSNKQAAVAATKADQAVRADNKVKNKRAAGNKYAQAPKGKINDFEFRLSGNEEGKTITAKAFAALPSDEQRKYVGIYNGTEYSYAEILNNKVLSKKLNMGESLEEDVLTEAPIIQFNPDELNNPSEVNFKKIIKDRTDKEEAEKAAAAAAARKAELSQKYSGLLDKVKTGLETNEQPSDTLEILFAELVPSQGMADTVAGELTRATMRLIYRSLNDGDKFYEGYGLETCGSSAEYLLDMGFNTQIKKMIENHWKYDSDDDQYDTDLESLTKDVIEYILANPELLAEPNEEDSRDYPVDYIEENQPMYEFEVYGSDDVVLLVENGILNAWDLNHYVENMMEYESVFRTAHVSRPWSHTSTNVEIENLTKDGYERFEDWFRDVDRFWEDLVDEYADDLETIKNGEDDYDDEYEEDDIDESFSSIMESSTLTEATSTDFITVGDILEGSNGNMDDDLLTHDVKMYNRMAKLFGLNKPDDIICYVDYEGLYTPTDYVHNGNVEMNNQSCRDFIGYTVPSIGITLFAETRNGNNYIYFLNTEDGQKYIDYIDQLNEW